jgi:ribosome biogenesis protein SSF1/2
VVYPNTDLKLGTKHTLYEGLDYNILISNTEKGAYFKIHKLPHGPNTTFHIESFSLSADVRGLQNSPHMLSAHYTSHAVLVTKGIKDDKLIKNSILALFPAPINLKVCKRVALFAGDGEGDLIHFRHFQITRGLQSTNKAAKVLSQGKIPDLSKYNNISEWVLENSGDGNDPEESKLPLSIQELGPRLTLSLRKIEYRGKLLYHKYKTTEEINETIKEYIAKDELR